MHSFRLGVFSAFMGAVFVLGGGSFAFAQDDLVPLIVSLLGDKDKEVRALAFEQVRTEAKGEAATLKFAELLPTLPPETQVGLLSALSSRGDSAAAPAVRSLLGKSNEETVRVAAIEALGSLGSGEDAALLAKFLVEESKSEKTAARGSLVRLPGEAASAAIVAEMQRAATPQRLLLIEILTTRRAGIPELLEAAIDEDPAVRGAAMVALGEIAAPEQVAGMAKGVIKAKAGRERIVAERAVTQVCLRNADISQRAAPLLAVIGPAPIAEKIILLPTLGRVGGPKALEVVEKAFGDKDSKMHSAGLAALCNWPDGSIAARLLELARTEEHPEHRKLALKALIRIAPLPDGRTDQRRLDLLKTTFAMCDNDADRNLVLQRASGIRTLETFHYASSFLKQPKFAQQACETLVELAHHRGLREPNKAAFDTALDQVMEISKDAVVVERAKRYKQGQTWVRPKTEKAT